MGVVDLLGIISFFLLSLVVRKLVVGYLKDTNAGECSAAAALVIKVYLHSFCLIVSFHFVYLRARALAAVH